MSMYVLMHSSCMYSSCMYSFTYVSILHTSMHARTYGTYASMYMCTNVCIYIYIYVSSVLSLTFAGDLPVFPCSRKKESPIRPWKEEPGKCCTQPSSPDMTPEIPGTQDQRTVRGRKMLIYLAAKP